MRSVGNSGEGWGVNPVPIRFEQIGDSPPAPPAVPRTVNQDISSARLRLLCDDGRSENQSRRGRGGFQKGAANEAFSWNPHCHSLLALAEHRGRHAAKGAAGTFIHSRTALSLKLGGRYIRSHLIQLVSRSW